MIRPFFCRWLGFLLILTCYPLSGLAGDAPLAVVASILPQKYFIERIGGERESQCP